MKVILVAVAVMTMTGGMVQAQAQAQTAPSLTATVQRQPTQQTQPTQPQTQPAPKPLEIGLQGVVLFQQVADPGFSGYVQCDNSFSPNQHKGPICKALRPFNGSMDICDGKVQSLSVAAGFAQLAYIDRVFEQSVQYVEDDFGKPSVITDGNAEWHLGDVNWPSGLVGIAVHELYQAQTDGWYVWIDVTSAHSRSATFGCRADGAGKYGKVVDGTN